MSKLDQINPMQLALSLAKTAVELNEVPVGAVIVDPNGQIVASAHNETRLRNDPTLHAEVLAIRRACAKLGQERLHDCKLYVTLEPCNMCATAISFARIKTLIYGAEDEKGGAVDNGTRFYHSKTCHHAPEVIGGIEEVASEKILKDFFKSKRSNES